MRVSKIDKFNKSIIPQGETAHSIITFIASFLAIGIMIYLGVRHFQDIDEYGRAWGRFALLHVFFGVLGHIGIQSMVFVNKSRNSVPVRSFFIGLGSFRPIKWISFLWALVVFGLIMLIQLMTSFMQYEITATEQALYYVFSAVTEELFFRGLLCYVVLYAVFRENIYNNRHIPSMITKGVVALVSGVIFGICHKNYYGTNMIYAVIIGGCIMGLFFVYISKFDLTAMILGHFMINILATGTWLINL